MRIRTANGLGLVRLVVALVVTVVVMSGSAFGQDKQSGRVVKPKKATGQNVSAQQSGKKGVVSPVLQVPKEADVKVQDYSPGTAYVDADGPEDAPRSSAPAFTMPPDPWNSAGGGSGNAPGGGSSNGSGVPDPPCYPENAFCYCSWIETFPPFQVGDCTYTSSNTHSLTHSSRIECPTRPIANSHVCLNGSVYHWGWRIDSVQTNSCNAQPELWVLHRGTDFGNGGDPPRRCSN